MKRFAILTALLALWSTAAEATCWLKKDTAVDLAMGPFVDSTDGVTAKAALTLSQADVRLKKNGDAWAQKNDTTTCVGAGDDEENGWYECPLNTTDTNQLGRLVIAINESGALPVWKECMVVSANNYEALIGTGTAFDSNGAIKVQSGTGSNQIDLSSGRIKDDKPAVGRIALKKGTTSYILYIYIESELTGGPLTGLVFNSASLACYYSRSDQGNAAATAISLVTATRGSYTSSGFVEKDATNAKGWYELGIPAAVIASGASSAQVTCAGASNMKPATVFIELVDNVSADLVDQPAGTYIRNTSGQRAHPFFMRSTVDVQSGVTGASPTVVVAKDGATSFSATTGTVAEAGNGAYWFSPSDADVDCNSCYFKVTAANSVPYFFYIFTIQ